MLRGSPSGWRAAAPEPRSPPAISLEASRATFCATTSQPEICRRDDLSLVVEDRPCPASCRHTLVIAVTLPYWLFLTVEHLISTSTRQIQAHEGVHHGVLRFAETYASLVGDRTGPGSSCRGSGCVLRRAGRQGWGRHRARVRQGVHDFAGGLIQQMVLAASQRRMRMLSSSSLQWDG